jgi:rhodanese-related sulfurtransferase
MNPRELIKRMQTKTPPVVADVRSGFEFRSGHIPAALHSPTWKILLRIAKLPAARDTEIVLTCEHGPRAQVAKKLLEMFGYSQVVLLDGHMAAWRSQRLPLER